jgi:hypothetical protein
MRRSRTPRAGGRAVNAETPKGAREQRTAELMDWQRRFRAGPKVWLLVYQNEEGAEDLCSIYESKEAAQVALDWYRQRGRRGKGYGIRSENVHSLELAQERWR